MFLKTSRYYGLATVGAVTAEGREVKAVQLRRLPAVKGEATTVKGFERLDILAERMYGNGTMFWHIADANSQLQATDLIKTTDSVLLVPRQ